MKIRWLYLSLSFLVSALAAQGAPEIDVRGANNAASIPAGDVSPSIFDGTDFRTVLLPSVRATNSFTITNTGIDILYLTGPEVVALTGDSGDFLAYTSGMVTNIAAGGSTAFKIIFDPASMGMKTCIVTIANNDSDENPYEFVVKGTAVAPEIGVLGTNSVSITNGTVTTAVADGTAYATLFTNWYAVTNTFTITNSGSSRLYLMASQIVTITGDTGDFSAYTGSTVTNIAINSFTTFAIIFRPIAAGLRTGIVSIVNSDSGANPYTFAISGYGTDVPEPEMEVHGASGALILNGDIEPAAADGTDFGRFDMGDLAVTNVFTITNNGIAVLYLTDPLTVMLTGDTGDFAVDAAGMVTNIAIGASTTFRVVFDPTFAGMRTGIVSIANNDSDANPYVFGVQGRVRPLLGVISGNFGGGWAKQLVAAPARVDGVVAVNNWNFFNCGNNNNDLGLPHTVDGLVDSTGDATPASATIIDINAASWGDSLTGPATSILGSGEVDDNGGPAKLTITGIPYARYDVYAYAGEMSQGTRDQAIELVTPVSMFIPFTNTSTDSAAGIFNDATIDGGGNYVKFSGLTTNQVVIKFHRPGNRGGYASGFQIVQLPPLPEISNDANASNVTAVSAYLNGILVMTDSAPTEVWAYWGKTDGGTNVSSWSNSCFFGTNISECPVTYTTNVVLPDVNTVYYYRYCQRNAFFVNWADSTAAFVNDVVSLEGTDTNASEAWLNTASFRAWRSTATTNQAIRVNYTLGGTASNGIDYVSLPGFVIIPAGDTNADVVIVPLDDSIQFQTNHFISITLAEGGYVIGIQKDTIVTIVENDTNGAYSAASIGITFGDGTQGPPLGSHTGPGVLQDYWNNIDVRPWQTFMYERRDAGIHYETGFGPYETNKPTIIATRDSHNSPVEIGFVTSNRAQVLAAGWNSGWGGFTGTAPVGPNTTNYDKQVVSYSPGNSGGPNWIKISGIPYNNYDVYIWAMNINLGSTNTGTYFNGPACFSNQTGDLYMEGAEGAQGNRSISYIQIVENPVPPAINNEPGPIDRSDGSSARLRGTLLATNGSPALVWVYWGPYDGQTNATNWANSTYFGYNTTPCPVTNSTQVTLPWANTTYYYRYCASNSVGLGWANSTTNFRNQGGTTILIR